MDGKAEAEDVPKMAEKIVPMKTKAVRKGERENIPLPEGGARRVQAASAVALAIGPEPSGRFADFFYRFSFERSRIPVPDSARMPQDRTG